MNLDQIRSLVSVVNNKSFSLAAKELYLSQPTISMHIKTLEKELGEQLLTRSTKDIVLTDSGMIFFPYAVRILKMEEQAVTKLKKKDREIKGEVLIASSSVPTNYILPGFLAYSKKTAPDISYKIAEGDSTEVIKKITHFEQEIGIASICPSNTKCSYEPIVEDKIVLITPNTQKYRDFGKHFDKSELKNNDFVIREKGSGSKLAVDSIEKRLGLRKGDIRVSAEVETSETLKRVVSEGVGIGFVSILAAKDYYDQGKILIFEFPEIHTTRQLYLIKNDERSLSRAAEHVISMIRKYCSEFI